MNMNIGVGDYVKLKQEYELYCNDLDLINQVGVVQGFITTMEEEDVKLIVMFVNGCRRSIPYQHLEVIDQYSDIKTSPYPLLDVLETVKFALQEICEETGANEMESQIKQEIKRYGWAKIVNRYHPDMNLTNPAAHELFDFYKYIYEEIKTKGEI